MKPILIAALALLFSGCESGPGRTTSGPLREIELIHPDDLSREPTSVDLEEFPLALEPATAQEPHPTLARAVEHGEAQSSGPVTNERYALWVRNADLQVRLAGQKGRLMYLQDLLKLSSRSEDEFIERLKLDNFHTGFAPDRHLKIFGVVKTRVRGEIEQTKHEIDELQGLLAQTITTSDYNLSTNENSIMLHKTLTEYGLTSMEIDRLAEIGIRGPRDFIEHFCLPEQHESLAALLGRDIDNIRTLIAEIAGSIPADELRQLAAQARKPRSFGVLPPEADKERTEP